MGTTINDIGWGGAKKKINRLQEDLPLPDDDNSFTRKINLTKATVN